MAHDATTLNGQVLGVVIAVTSTFNACCTTFGYYSIKTTVDKSKATLKSFRKSHSTNNSYHHHKNSIASQCLTTYVWVAACLYCPLAILLWVNVLFQIVMKSVEPLSSFFIVIVANSSGWANAYGYFHNEKLKNFNRKLLTKETSNDCNSSSSNV